MHRRIFYILRFSSLFQHISSYPFTVPVPVELITLARPIFNGAEDIQTAHALQRQVLIVRKSLSVGKSWLSAMKYLGYLLHLSSTDYTSFPIEPLTEDEKARIDRIVEESGL